MKPSFNKAVSRRVARLQQEGVALVITLLMLSIITFMAVTFLVLSQRERSSVTTATDMKIARDASDAALARVSAELLTHMLVQSNFQDFDLMVSTNYINYAGFVDGLAPNPTNVNYDYEIDGTRMSTAGAVPWERNIADLLYNPRPPVFVVTNSGTGAADFRFYLDLNRNGRYDANGNWPVLVNDGGNWDYLTTNNAGQFVVPVRTNAVAGLFLDTNFMVGDPEWIGMLEHPDQMHSADNQFISRYAYVVVPVGKTLDVNYMYNQSVLRTVNNTSPGQDGFMRNQGVGPWEENLAGFLVDLNTNEWDQFPVMPPLISGYYQYNEGDTNSPQFGRPNSGIAFDDARALINYRYANNYGSLATANSWFGLTASAKFANNGVDQYSDGPLMLGTTANENSPPDATSRNWPGADNTNHFFSPEDFFDPTKSSVGFVTRLQNAGTSNDTYNAYTFYRLLASMGTDSASDNGKININFKNTDANGVVVPGMETNMIPWTPIDFFTTAANAMFQQLNLRDFNGNLVTTTNIPIYETNSVGFVVNYYTPEVHRILQLAANMYDATTTRYINGGPTNYPSVFRPEFASHAGVVYIAGYLEVTNAQDAFNFFVDPQAFSTVDNPIRDNINMYGVPWVIGVKKGFPNFNEISMNNPLTVSRKLQFTNSTGNGPATDPWVTNQLYDFSITNSYGVEFWNSYTNMYGRPLRLVVTNEVSVVVSNESGVALSAQNRIFGNDITSNFWPGWTMQLSDSSMAVPLYVSETFTNGTYLHQPPWVVPITPTRWDAITVPQVYEALQFRFRAWLIDTSVNRVIDFVNIVDRQPQINVSSYLSQGTDNTISPTLANQWSTVASSSGALMGIMNQIYASEGAFGTMPDWKDTAANIAYQQQQFRTWLNNGGTNNFQAPYTPMRVVSDEISLQANDPLVHYTLDDLMSTNGAMATHNRIEVTPKTTPLDNLTNLNLAYQPWGGMGTPLQRGQNPNPTFDNNWQVKDPGIEQADGWDFPTNKLPNIGWMGRIHRGTPWQTIYMKPANITPDLWRTWNNDKEFITNGNVVTIDAALSHPTEDYGLFDLFTTSINNNASRSRLDVNQTNLAAWSAILSGVNILTNGVNGVGPAVIAPAGVYDATNLSPLAYIVNGINSTRANTDTNSTIFLNHTFQHLGDVFATPQLTVASPYLNTNYLSQYGAGGISDEVMERIPQQVASLLTLNQTPRFVIYSFGQTLHPADHSLVMGGQFNGLCTNYQITAESATRAVVRVEGTPDPQYVNGRTDSLGRSYPPHIVVEQFNVLGPD